MSNEYADLRSELADLQRRFNEQGKNDPDLNHVVCHYPDEHGCDECLPESAWAAFIRDNSHLPDGRWSEWHLLNEGRWCGRFYGTGSLHPKFVSLATEAVAIIRRLSAVSGVGEVFFVQVPSQPDLDLWLRLLYDTADLCITPTLRPEWRVPLNCEAPLPFRLYWSGPDPKGASYPLHPNCMALPTDVFSCSAEVIDVFLTPRCPFAEYRDYLLPYESEGYCVPPYLPENPWNEEILESLGKCFEGIPRQRSDGSEEAEQAITSSLAKGTSTPLYDKKRRELWLRGKCIRKIRRIARWQEPLLVAFQDAGWPPQIPCPYSDPDLGPRRRQRTLRDAIDAFNKLGKKLPSPRVSLRQACMNLGVWVV